MNLARARWRAMKARCYNPKNKSYTDYGARGIRVCDRWHDFDLYYQDIGPAPPSMTLERVDNNSHYEPGNCRWDSRQAQAENRRNVRRLEWAGMSMPLKEWCRKAGMPYKTVHYRLGAGWPWPQALYVPVGGKL
jgi:hypothetical protein